MPLDLQRRGLVATTMLAMLAPGAHGQARRRRVGFIAQIARPEPLDPHIFGALARGLRELGYVEGQSLAMDWRFGNGDVGKLPALAAELVQAQPEVVVAAGTLAAIAMRQASASLPVVFGNVSDPLGAGLIQSLNRPGTNLTGMASLHAAIMPKLLELVLEALPAARAVGLLTNPLQPSHKPVASALEPVAQARRIRLATYGATTQAELDQAFAAMARDRMDVVVLPNEGLFIQHRRQIAQLGSRHRVPIASVDDELAALGALVTYGADQHAMFHALAGYVDRILRGARPQDMPVEQPSRLVLAVNRRAERDLQLRLPQALIVRADRVIE